VKLNGTPPLISVKGREEGTGVKGEVTMVTFSRHKKFFCHHTDMIRSSFIPLFAHNG
jgi:hypothetical protein